MENLFLATGALLFAFGSYIKYEKMLSHPSKITPTQAKIMIKNGAKVIDVRSKLEFNLGTHPKAVNIPGPQLSIENLKKNKVNKDDTIVVYCNSGTRARKASEKLVSFGYKNSYYIVETYLSLL